MGRHSCCVKQKLKKGLWSPEEDEKLFNHIAQFGVGCWSSVPKLAGKVYSLRVVQGMSVNVCVILLMHCLCRFAEVRKELQIEMDQLLEA